MPLDNLVGLTLFFFAAALVYRFRHGILRPIRRWAARNAARRAEEARALFDRHAHYRHTLEIAEEQVEDIEKIRVADDRTGTPVERFLFLGVHYASLDEAQAARQAEVFAKAREFYLDLDRYWLPRGGGERETLAPKLPPPRPPRP